MVGGGIKRKTKNTTTLQSGIFQINDLQEILPVKHVNDKSFSNQPYVSNKQFRHVIKKKELLCISKLKSSARLRSPC